MESLKRPHLPTNLSSSFHSAKRISLLAALALMMSTVLVSPLSALAATRAPKTTQSTPQATATVPTLKTIFNARFYADANPDVKAKYGYNETKLYRHCLNYGVAEGRVISPILDLKVYREGNPDLEKAFGNNWKAYLDHFFNYGMKEFLSGQRGDAGILFNPTIYAAAYADVRAAYGDDIWAIVEHYAVFGIIEGRTIGVVPPSLRPLNPNNKLPNSNKRPSTGQKPSNNVTPSPVNPSDNGNNTNNANPGNNGGNNESSDNGNTNVPDNNETRPAPDPETPVIPNPDKPDGQKPDPVEPAPENPDPEKPTPEVPDPTPENPNPEKPTPETPSTPDVPVVDPAKTPVEVEIAPEVKDKSGTATTTIGADKTAIQAIETALTEAANNAENQDKALTVTVDTTKAAGSATALAATLSPDVITALEKQSTDLKRPITVTVKSAVGDVVLPLEALKGAQGKDGGAVVLAVSNIEASTLPKDGEDVKDLEGNVVEIDKAVIIAVDLKVGDQTASVKDLKNQIQISVAAPETASGKVNVYFVNTTKKKLEFVTEATVDKDTGKAIFEVNHLTDFVLTEKAEETKTPEPEQPKDPDPVTPPVQPEQPKDPDPVTPPVQPEQPKDPDPVTPPVTPTTPSTTPEDTTPPVTVTPDTNI